MSKADARIDLIFTMSDNRTAGANRPRRCKTLARTCVLRMLRTSVPSGGARRDRTDDLLLAKQALSQLSYGPSRRQNTEDRGQIVIRPSSSVF